jgi:glycosyltransferase involved in cell wall biosynthesis
MVASKALGGAERWAIRFSLALAERGSPVDLAIRRGSGLDDLDYGSLQVHRLPFLTTWDPLSRDAVSRTIARVRPDIVQTYMGRATRLTHLSPSKGPVHLARLGGYYALGPFRHAHGWIGNTKQLCDWMVQNGLPADRVHHIYNFAEPVHPVAPERVAELRARHGVPDEARVMVALGRLVGFKGHRHLVDAMARLPETIEGRPLRLIIVGDGPLGPALHRQAIEVGQDKRILWTGWEKDPSAYLQMADLVVFPSLDEEPMGNVILEAWAWRKPLVTANFRGAREIVRHGEDGWTVPCADAIALAGGIREVLSDPTLMSGLAERGHGRVQRDFSRDAILDQYLALYRELAR